MLPVNYATAVLPGLFLTAFDTGLALRSASMTTGVEGRYQGLAGAPFTAASRPGRGSGSPPWPRWRQRARRTQPARRWPATAFRYSHPR